MLMGRTASCFSLISVPSSPLILLGEGAALSILMILIRIQQNIIFLETWLNIYIEKVCFCQPLDLHCGITLSIYRNQILT